jgi:hypothetical protein
VQQKNNSNRSFFERTEKLCRHHGVSVRKLASIIGISQATLFNARKSSEITKKTWSKLEQAEKKIEHEDNCSKISRSSVVQESAPEAGHPLVVAEAVGALDEEERTLDEIRVRIQQFKHAERKRRDLYSQQIMNRVQEYNDWCETFAKPIRESQVSYARKIIQSKPPTTTEK